jgi:protoheme ferro-lyase
LFQTAGNPGRISVEGKEQFMEAGGENFTYIPCLNDGIVGLK